MKTLLLAILPAMSLGAITIGSVVTSTNYSCKNSILYYHVYRAMAVAINPTNDKPFHCKNGKVTDTAWSRSGYAEITITKGLK